MTELALPAPAKLNLFLHVIGRRSDGYHELQTLFQFIDVCDQLHFSANDSGRIERLSDTAGLAAEDDLVVRAARILQQHSACQSGVSIRIDKHIPMGAGLGGGSSDAATTLLGLNQLWRLGLDEDSLATLGLQLGADVPVFIRGRAAWAEGIGERLEPVDVPEPWFVVIRPHCAVNTAEIFNAPELTRHTRPITIRDFLAGAGHNDCEPVVRKHYPEVAQALDWLGAYAPSRMTGTGSCVFASFATQQAARQIADSVPKPWQAFAARGLNHSPVFARRS